jgi:hypothetical protein
MPEPEFSRLPAVPICETGTWITSTGIFTFTPEDFAAAVEAVEGCPAVRVPIIKLGHGPITKGMPAVGHVAAMRVTNSGETLTGDLEGMPPGFASIAAETYPDRSIEGRYGYVCAIGHTHPFVITALSLLGVEEPAVGTLTSLLELYGVAAETPTGAGAFTVHPSERVMPKQVDASTSTADVERAFYDDAPWDQWIRRICLDPPEVIVESDDGLLAVPYTISGDTVTFAEPRPVVEEYRDKVAAAKPRPVLASYSSREEARRRAAPKASQTPPAPAGGPEKKETGMDPVMLRESLGLAADASDIEVQAKLAAEGLIPKSDTAPADPEVPKEDPPVEPEAPKVEPEKPEGAGPDLLKEVSQLSGEIAAMRAREAKAEKDKFFAAAGSQGRIKPNEEKDLRAMYDEAPKATRAFIEARAIGSAVPVTEVGHADTGSEGVLAAAAAVRDTAAYKNWSLA